VVNNADNSQTASADNWLIAAQSDALVAALNLEASPVTSDSGEVFIPQSLSAAQWYLGSSSGYDLNVEDVWLDYTGHGVTVGVVDSGVQMNHPELIGNYDTSIDYDFLTGQADGGYKLSSDTHGTSVMGVIGAANDGVGTTGVAYGATLTSFRLVSNQGIYASQVRDAFLRDVDVSNNSWGWTQPFAAGSFTSTIESAFQTAVTSNRGGLGTVFVFAAGNAGANGDNVNYSEMGNSRFTIQVAAGNENGTLAYFSTQGAPVLVTAPGTNIYTTDITGSLGYSSGSYTTVQGTSFASPAVAGVVALMLEANPNLGYRDVQSILANSAIKTDPGNTDWTWNGDTNWNGGGHHVNHGFGLGWVDAKAAVRLSETWLVDGSAAGVYSNEARATYTSATLNQAIDNTTYNNTITVINPMDIEHVEVQLNFTHANIQQLVISLFSPDGTQSVLLSHPPNNSATFTYDSSWSFSTTHDWGETGVGSWRLQITDTANGVVGSLTNWTLRLYGNAVDNNDTYIYTDEYSGFTGNGYAARRVLTDISGSNDTINASAVTSDITLNLTPGSTGNIIAGNTLTISSNTTIENAYGGDGNDTITGNSANNILWGGRGNDILNGGAGNDIMYGGAGDDIYYVDSLDDVVIENPGEGYDIIYSTLANYVLSANVELLQILGNGSTITGTAGDDVISGSNGDDNISGVGGNDSLFGNNGNDILNGGDGNDRLFGGAGNDILYGGNGNDQLTGNAGTDTLYGGVGDDLYVVDDATDVVIENAGEGTDTVYTTLSYTLTSNVENLILAGSSNLTGTGNELDNAISGNSGQNTLYGGDGNDTLSGQNQNDTLYGGNGNDYLYGGGGADTMIGGAGNDRYQVDNVGDIVTENANEGTDLVESSITYTLGNYVEDLRLTGSATINGTGNALSNTITGNDANNTLLGMAGNDILSGAGGDDILDGGTGNDYMMGGLGNDTYYVDSSGDTVYEAANAGTDLVIASASFSLMACPNVENLTLTGSASINGWGNAFNNTLIGNSGNNTLEGNGGDDIIYGWGGNDLLNGGAGDDTLYGGDGDDILYGYTGNDTMVGGSGNDKYYVDDVGDSVVESAGEGTDWIYASVTYTMSVNVEILAMTGTANIDATGNASDNSMVGNSGNNTIDGGDGNDSISGGAGNDTLIGGNGNDVLRGGFGNDNLLGGSGNDTYRYTEVNFGADTITDTSGTDLIDLGIFSVFSVASWQALDSNNDSFMDQLLIDFGSGNSLTINNYFDNTSIDDDLCGAGAGVIENIVFNNTWINFNEAQGLIA